MNDTFDIAVVGGGLTIESDTGAVVFTGTFTGAPPYTGTFQTPNDAIELILEATAQDGAGNFAAVTSTLAVEPPVLGVEICVTDTFVIAPPDGFPSAGANS